ncbi:MAG: beta-phosphoglucomutase [Spirochaetales bacterium]|nr:beta-phosphoglucomutase [Spirochaetales bacterium]
MSIRAVIFDLDGVIVSTDEYHFHAWKMIADREGIPFDRTTNEALRGVSRMESLEIILRKATRAYSPGEKKELAEQKNNFYRESLNDLTPGEILPGVLDVLASLKARGIKVAIGSSSRNAKAILSKIGLDKSFDEIVDGTDISRSKPDPEVFSLGAERLGISPEECLVVEDAEAGIDAALAAGMRALGVGSAAQYPKSHYAYPDLEATPLDEILNREATTD